MHRLAGSKSLQTGASMIPLTHPHNIAVVPEILRRVGNLRFPGNTDFLKEIIDTDYGPMQVTMTGMGDFAAQDIGDRMKTLTKMKQLVTVNPEVLNSIQRAGDQIRGIGSVDFGWLNPKDRFGEHKAPAEYEGGARRIIRAVQDVYQNKMIPAVMQANPGKDLWITNEPTTWSRERLYKRAGMGPVDPMGMQHSFISPAGHIQPVEIFGGAPPSWLG